MKYFLLVLFLQLSFHVFANETVDGYVVMANKDTIRATIKITGKLPVTDYYTLVLIENGVEKQHFAKDRKILAYGFDFGQISYSYRFFDIKKGYGSGFFRLIEDGQNFQLFEGKVKSATSASAVSNSHYVLVKSSGESQNFTTSLFSKWKNTLKEFIGDNPEAKQALNDVKRTEVPNFVRLLNSL